jgi:hypothetical protein
LPLSWKITPISASGNPLTGERKVKMLPHKSNKSKNVPKSRNKLKITATVYHITRDESFYLTEFRTVDGAKKTKLIGRELFRRPSTIVDTLLRTHADLPDDGKEAVRLVKEAVRDRSNKKYQLTNRTGWYGPSFVYLTETFGELAGELRHEGASDIDPALGLQQGTAEAWGEGLRNPCRYSDFLLFALSVPASGPLLDLIEEDEGAIFHLQPQSPPLRAMAPSPEFIRLISWRGRCGVGNSKGCRTDRIRNVAGHAHGIFGEDRSQTSPPRKTTSGFSGFRVKPEA